MVFVRWLLQVFNSKNAAVQTTFQRSSFCLCPEVFLCEWTLFEIQSVICKHKCFFFSLSAATLAAKTGRCKPLSSLISKPTGGLIFDLSDLIFK